jgi:hypothetical protein
MINYINRHCKEMKMKDEERGMVAKKSLEAGIRKMQYQPMKPTCAAHTSPRTKLLTPCASSFLRFYSPNPHFGAM